MDKVIIESPFVNSLFKCPLCNELIHLATVINECLHRFCKLCITNYFITTNNKTCPICQIILINPLQTLKSDLTFQRLLYKIFPQREIACKSSLLIPNDSTFIQIDTKINVYLKYWDISLDRFPMESSIRCYLECIANTPLKSIEKFLRIKYSIASKLKIDFFYKSFLLNIENERLIDIYYCFDIINQNSSLDIRFFVSSYGYKSILKRIHQSKRSPVPLKIEVSTDKNSSSLSSTSSMDSTLKVKICRSQSSTNDWFIPQSTPSIQLPDLINSCKKISLKKKFKPRRRIRFIPTMVKVPPSIFDCLSNNQYESNEMMIDNLTDTSKVPPYIFEYSLFDSVPLDLSLK